MSEPGTRARRKAIAEAFVALAMLALAFVAIASSDVSATGTHLYWSSLILLFAVISFVADRMYSGHSLTDAHSAIAIVLHWIGVLAAVQLVYFFVSSGRMANADLGLTNGMILALGTFLAGAHGNWRLLVVGAALGAATVTVAFVEEYVWVLVGIALLAALAFVLGSRVVARFQKARA